MVAPSGPAAFMEKVECGCPCENCLDFCTGKEMSWAITINNLPEYEGFPEDIIEKMLTHHMLYPFDMNLALEAAKKAGLKSATLGGGRTISPYTGEEVVTITITGMSEATDFNSVMKRIVVQPDDEPK